MRYHLDERRAFYGDIFANPDGDINIVYLAKGVPIGWHRHQHQSDRLFLVSGVLRVRVFETDVRERVENILTDSDRGVIYIPSGYWHGYESLTDNTVVLQFNGPGKYDGTDEERCEFDVVPWSCDPT